MTDTSEREHCLRLGKILATIGDKWTVMVIGLLSRGTLRHSELKRGMDGVSQRMLTLTLRSLERDGLVSREVFPTVPPRVEYTLTPLGHTLIEPLKTLADWAQTHLHEVEDSQVRHDLKPVP